MPQKTVVVSLDSVVGAVTVMEKSRLIAVGIKLNPFRNCSGENGEIKLELEYITVSHFLPFNGKSYLPLRYEVSLSSPLPSKYIFPQLTSCVHPKISNPSLFKWK